MISRSVFPVFGISIHVPRVEDDFLRGRDHRRRPYFNPRPPCGGRLPRLDMTANSAAFQSTSPVWRTTQGKTAYPRAVGISIHVPRVEDDCGHDKRGAGGQNISIHVPRVEDDLRSTSRTMPEDFISIHVPRVEDDADMISEAREDKIFQSTSPVWRTTAAGPYTSRRLRHFNPRPPCGGRYRKFCREYFVAIFQSTSPVWRTTVKRALENYHFEISIHVPRVEDDDVGGVCF